MAKSRILVVDDRMEICTSARFVLEDHGYEVFDVQSPKQAIETLKSKSIDLVLLDMNYSRDTTSGEEGLSFLSWYSDAGFKAPVVAMTAWSNISLAVEAMQNGACDFIEKPWKNTRLLKVIQHQINIVALGSENRKLRQRLADHLPNSYQWHSSSMKRLLGQVSKVADTDVSVLLMGESGTGKSRLARYIHDQSSHKSGPFITVNMGGISESLFESEMFGHKKGAFTDAKNDRIGRFELAENGTLFLDEVANIPLSQQIKLLRVLDSGEYEVLGTSQTKQANVRLISATNGDFEKLISKGDFREDLFYRLSTIGFRLPSLSERYDDIIPLAQHFLRVYAKSYNRKDIEFSKDVIKSLQRYIWPGNIRELNHLVQRAVILSESASVNLDDINISFDDKARPLPSLTLEELEKKMIQQVLSSSDNNISRAAAALGLTKSSLYRRLEKFSDIQE